MTYRGRIAPSPTGLLHLGPCGDVLDRLPAVDCRFGNLGSSHGRPRPAKIEGGVRRGGDRRSALARHSLARGSGCWRAVCSLHPKRAARDLPRGSAEADRSRTRLPLPMLAQRSRAVGAGSARRRAVVSGNVPTGLRPAFRRNSTTRRRPASTGASASRMAKQSSSTMATLGRSGLLPEKTLATSWSGGKMESPPTSSRSPLTTRRWPSPKSFAEPTCSSPRRGRYWCAARSDCRSPPGITARSSPTNAARDWPNATMPSV